MSTNAKMTEEVNRLGGLVADLQRQLAEATSRLSEASLSRWIPVSERAPENGATVLAFWYPAAPGNGVDHRCYAKATFVNGCWRDAESGDGYADAHFWMPLPEAPK